MKLFSLYLTIHLFISTTAFASTPPESWTTDFYDTYYSTGIDEAVLFGLSQAKAPDEIVKTALPITDLNQPRLIQALFCAPVLPGDIYAAAESNGISEETVSQGYELALAACTDIMEESLAVVANPTTRSETSQSSAYASPSTF